MHLIVLNTSAHKSDNISYTQRYRLRSITATPTGSTSGKMQATRTKTPSWFRGDTKKGSVMWRMCNFTLGELAALR